VIRFVSEGKQEAHILIHQGGLADTNRSALWAGKHGWEVRDGYPLSPRMMTLRRAFRRGAAMVSCVRCVCVVCALCLCCWSRVWLTSVDGLDGDGDGWVAGWICKKIV